MTKKRLTIELSADRHEALQRQAKTKGTTVTGLLRRMIDDFCLRSRNQGNKDYLGDPLNKRCGSFDGPADLSENHDRYLY